MSIPSAAYLARILANTNWQSLSDTTLRELTSLGALQTFNQDDVLEDSIYIVLEGLIAAIRGYDSERSAVTALYLGGDLVDICKTPQDPFDRLVALKPTRVVVFPVEGFNAAMQRQRDLSATVCDNFKRQMFNLREHAAELFTKAPDQRLAAFLLWLEAVSGLSDERSEFDLPMRRYDLARYLGMQPETLSRKIKALIAQGAISQRSPSRLVIESRSALEDLAAGLRRVA